MPYISPPKHAINIMSLPREKSFDLGSVGRSDHHSLGVHYLTNSKLNVYTDIFYSVPSGYKTISSHSPNAIAVQINVFLKKLPRHTVMESPLGFQEVEASRISRQSAHAGGKVAGPMHLPS
jgi:hypothetical protein